MKAALLPMSALGHKQTSAHVRVMSALCQKRWLESASRVERLTALIEDLSKNSTPTTEYVWQLPPFHDRPRNRNPLK